MTEVLTKILPGEKKEGKEGKSKVPTKIEGKEDEKKKEFLREDAGMTASIYYIKDWNFVDDDDKKVPITKESIGLLPQEDFSYLMKKATESLVDKKKEVKE